MTAPAASRRARRQTLPLLAALAVALTGCDADPPPPATRPNVVLVLIDTLRADRLGAYGNSRQLTPFLDQLAARGTVFRHAYAQSCWTNPSVASLFTSRFASQHGVVAFGSRLEPTELTLAEAFQGLGYATGGFLASAVLQVSNGFAQGFDQFEAFWPPPETRNAKPFKQRGDTLNLQALRWLDGLPRSPVRPVFLYVHYVEPHVPYTPPPPMIDRVRMGRPRPDVDEVSRRMVLGNWARPDATAIRAIMDVYDAEVLSLDDTLRQLFATLEERRLLDDAVVVITADHGEEFLDHGHMGHGGTLYEELIHVPLLIRLPRQTAHADVPDVVSLIDVAPTLLELAGAPAPGSFEGRSLRARLAGVPRGWRERLAALWPDRAPGRPVFSELLVPAEHRRKRLTLHERAVVAGGRKLIQGLDGARERYDVIRDPTEDVALPAGPDDAALDAALDALRARAAPLPAAEPPVTPELREHLRALGYVDTPHQGQ